MSDKTSDKDRADRFTEGTEIGAIPPVDPIALARRDLQKSLPKRFYKNAQAEERDGAFALLLDGKPARTPAGNRLALPTLAAAEALAAEWNAQKDVIDPTKMPFTRIVNSAIDGVAAELAPTTQAIAGYGQSDLICYRAGEPESLVKAQAAAWDNILHFARETFGARFICAEGVIFVEQPDPALAALNDALEAFARRGSTAPFLIAALHVMTSLTGSVLIALAVAHRHLTASEAWAAAHVDEDYQIAIWGEDEEAMLRRAERWREMDAAATLWRLVA
jgi:chaperone required for assembly of F1-ATPase